MLCTCEHPHLILWPRHRETPGARVSVGCAMVIHCQRLQIAADGARAISTGVLVSNRAAEFECKRSIRGNVAGDSQVQHARRCGNNRSRVRTR